MNVYSTLFPASKMARCLQWIYFQLKKNLLKKMYKKTAQLMFAGNKKNLNEFDIGFMERSRSH